MRDAAGALHRVELEKEADDGLELAFTEALFDDVSATIVRSVS